MKLEQQVTSLEISKRLKELGVKQESLFWWIKGKIEWGYEGDWEVSESKDWFIHDAKPNSFDFKSKKGDEYEKMSDEEFVLWNERDRKFREEQADHVCSAFTVAELGEMLPEIIQSDGMQFDLEISKYGKYWYVKYLNHNAGSLVYMEVFTEADARGKMLIYLLENNLLKS